MTEDDRKIVLGHCKKEENDRIIVIHGTDTMVETAKVLGNSIKDKTIVLTGAMIPYKFGSSDGLFNLGSAIAFVQSLSHGVYIVMNGHYFTWDNVIKNIETGMFSGRFEKKKE